MAETEKSGATAGRRAQAAGQETARKEFLDTDDSNVPEAQGDAQAGVPPDGPRAAASTGLRGSETGMHQAAGAGGAVQYTENVLRDAIAATESVGSGLVGGVAHIATDVVHGVREIGGEVGVVVRDGATGAINVVGDVGGAAVHTVTHLLVDVMGGLREIAGAAVGHRNDGAGHAIPVSAGQVRPVQQGRTVDDDQAVQESGNGMPAQPPQQRSSSATPATT